VVEAAVLQASGSGRYAERAEGWVSRSLSDWEQWLVAGQAGDQTAYRRFLDAANSHLVRYFSRKAPPGDAADLVQETLLAIHKKRASYDARYPLLPWLNTIARYKWIDWLRSNRRAKHVEIGDVMIGIDPGEPAAGHALELLLQQVSPAQAEVIRLVKIDGLSIEEAARATGQGTSLVKVNIHRGIKKMIALVESRNE
jgi:RNA polymerase sigma-70 factor (ECF subfamily)